MIPLSVAGPSSQRHQHHQEASDGPSRLPSLNSELTCSSVPGAGDVRHPASSVYRIEAVGHPQFRRPETSRPVLQNVPVSSPAYSTSSPITQDWGPGRFGSSDTASSIGSPRIEQGDEFQCCMYTKDEGKRCDVRSGALGTMLTHLFSAHLEGILSGSTTYMVVACLYGECKEEKAGLSDLFDHLKEAHHQDLDYLNVLLHLVVAQKDKIATQREEVISLKKKDEEKERISNEQAGQIKRIRVELKNESLRTKHTQRMYQKRMKHVESAFERQQTEYRGLLFSDLGISISKLAPVIDLAADDVIS